MAKPENLSTYERLAQAAKDISNDKLSVGQRKLSILKLMLGMTLNQDLDVKLVCMHGLVAATKNDDVDIREKAIESLSSVIDSIENTVPMFDYMLKQLCRAVKRNAHMNAEIMQDFVSLLKGDKLTSMTQRRMVFRAILMTAVNPKDHALHVTSTCGLMDVYNHIPSHWQSRARLVFKEE